MQPSFSDYRPLTYVRGVPVYITTVIVATMVVGMFFTVFLEAGKGSIAPLCMEVSALWQRGEIWRLVTYPFLERPSFFYVFWIFFFYLFGVDVEKFVGRQRFLILYGLLVVAAPVVLSIGYALRLLPPIMFYGSDEIVIGIFIAFATLYPNLEYWGWITAKWLAFAGLLLSALSYFPSGNWAGLAVLLTMAGLSHGYIRLLQHGGMPDLVAPIKRALQPKPRLRVVRRDPELGTLREFNTPADTNIDVLLDKIARNGLDSLTPAERAELERASQNLRRQP